MQVFQVLPHKCKPLNSHLETDSHVPSDPGSNWTQRGHEDVLAIDHPLFHLLVNIVRAFLAILVLLQKCCVVKIIQVQGKHCTRLSS